MGGAAASERAVSLRRGLRRERNRRCLRLPALELERKRAIVVLGSCGYRSSRWRGDFEVQATLSLLAPAIAALGNAYRPVQRGAALTANRRFWLRCCRWN